MRRLITRLILLLALTALVAPALPDTAFAQSKRRSKSKKQNQGKGKAKGKATGAGKAKGEGKDKGEGTGKAKGEGKDKTQVFDFSGLDVTGQLRSPQLLYFLERATEELQRASLERRSFIPEMVRSVDEEAL